MCSLPGRGVQMCLISNFAQLLVPIQVLSWENNSIKISTKTLCVMQVSDLYFCYFAEFKSLMSSE